MLVFSAAGGRRRMLFGFGFQFFASISFSHIQFLNPYLSKAEKPLMVGFYQMVSNWFRPVVSKFSQ